MASATVLSVQVTGAESAVVQVSLDDVTLADKTVPRLDIQLTKRNLDVWLSAEANKGKTVNDYIQAAVDAAVANYNAMQNILSKISAGQKLSW